MGLNRQKHEVMLEENVDTVISLLRTRWLQGSDFQINFLTRAIRWLPQAASGNQKYSLIVCEPKPTIPNVGNVYQHP